VLTIPHIRRSRSSGGKKKKKAPLGDPAFEGETDRMYSPMAPFNRGVEKKRPSISSASLWSKARGRREYFGGGGGGAAKKGWGECIALGESPFLQHLEKKARARSIPTLGAIIEARTVFLGRERNRDSGF